MPPFEARPSTPHIKLIAHVYPMGGIDVRYAPEKGEPPFQAPALFGSRAGLAKKLKELGLNDEANTVTLSDGQVDFTFTVANTPELIDSFQFIAPGKLLG